MTAHKAFLKAWQAKEWSINDRVADFEEGFIYAWNLQQEKIDVAIEALRLQIPRHSIPDIYEALAKIKEKE